MARTIFGNKKSNRIDKFSEKYSESDVFWEKAKIVMWLVLAALYMYFIIQPQTFFK
jgi:hypothetical protein